MKDVRGIDIEVIPVNAEGLKARGPQGAPMCKPRLDIIR